MMRVVSAFFLLAFSVQSIAGDALVSWEHPTQYVDGTAIPTNGISRTEIEYGVCNAGKTGFLAAPAPVIVQVAYPTKERLVASLGAADWCFRARTVAANVADTTSDWTGLVWKTITMKLGPPVSIRVQ